MNCTNCGTDKANRLIIVPDHNGEPFQFCDLCPRPKKQELNFPAIVTSKRIAETPNRLSGSEDKFKNFELTPEQIAATQAQRTPSVYRETAANRYLDNEIPRKEGKRVNVYVGGTHLDRESMIRKKAMAKLGTDDIRKIQDNGVKAVFEVAH